VTIAQSLLSLQGTDQSLAIRRREYREVQTELDSEGGLPELRESCDKTRVRELEAKVETARLESDLAVLKDEVAELETRLYGGAITNVRELTAIETEHSSARRNLAQVEEAIAPAQVAAEHARQQFTDLIADLEAKEKAWKTRKIELRSEKTEKGTAFNEMLQIRNDEAAQIPDDHLARYTRLFRSNRGIAIVRVDRGVCQGCAVRLPVGELTRLRAADGPIPCSCGRALLTEH
jgi:predicted  nucleic acid-binding Zn-ribbon protein|tara:strand:- start:6046 stop:6747 length:702 start_codon:yes stop_codon:yes gene_type:complete